MANINKIEVICWTKLVNGAGTDDHVYLGLGGREFDLDTPEDDFREGQEQTFVLGLGSNIKAAHREKNDPRNPQLVTEDLDLFPVYIRKAGSRSGTDDDAWYVERVDVIVNPGEGETFYQGLKGRKALWLGNEMGLQFFLKPVARL
jgi:hypothetical protein